MLEFPLQTPVPYEPAPEFSELRRRRSLVRVRLVTGDLAWLATRYEDNRRLLADPRLSRAAAAQAAAPRARRVPLDARAITSMDPPEHTRLRGIVARAFTARQTERLRGGVERAADLLLDRMAAAGPPGDLVAGFTRPLPMGVICELLGVPPPDQRRFRAWSDAYLSVDSHSPEQIAEAVAGLKRYLAGLVAAKREAPGGDLLSVLVGARHHDRLSEAELVTLGVTLLVAGYETVAAQLANSAMVLLGRPERLAVLRDSPELPPKAVEELLRFVPISVSGGTIRVATEDLELGGVTVRAGEAVLPATSSANRDVAVFRDPDRLDLRRSPNPHLAFGHGIHHCLGANLARMQMRVALAALLRRLPGLRLAAPGEDLPWNRGKIIRCPDAIPVTWG